MATALRELDNTDIGTDIRDTRTDIGTDIRDIRTDIGTDIRAWEPCGEGRGRGGIGGGLTLWGGEAAEGGEGRKEGWVWQDEEVEGGKAWEGEGGAGGEWGWEGEAGEHVQVEVCTSSLRPHTLVALGLMH